MFSHDFNPAVSIRRFHTEEGSGDPDFLNLARKIAEKSHCAVLLSGGDLDCSRYSIAAWDPVCLLTSKGPEISFETAEGSASWTGDPLQALDDLHNAFSPDYSQDVQPFMGGLVGYASYELKNCIEKLPQTADDDLNLPDMFFFAPSKFLVHDRLENKLSRVELSFDLEPMAPNREHDACRGGIIKVGELESNFLKNDYLKAVAKVIDYIREGDIYQANLSQRYRFPFEGNPFLLWEKMFEKNPAPFYAFIHGGEHQIMCTSMERFLYRSGDYIETRPIKGTRPRLSDMADDERMRRELAASPKEHAELSMIVDLLRNDLSRMCRPRSVAVTDHRRLEAYENVHHAVSTVTGQLIPGISPGEILRASFPGGSITGCPKIRSMEIIDELEPNVRHVYTGSIGYIGWHSNMDLNIAIRTAIRKKDAAYFSVGGGIVYDSTPGDEFDETLHKARTLFRTLSSL